MRNLDNCGATSERVEETVKLTDANTLTDNQLNEIIYHLAEFGATVDEYCYGLPTSSEYLKEMRELIRGVILANQ